MTKRMCVTVLLALTLGGCAEMKPIVRSVHDLAQHACALFFSERQGLSAEDAAREFCRTEQQLRPWLEQMLAAQQAAGAQALSQEPAD
jgi:hypothetical protein